MSRGPMCSGCVRRGCSIPATSQTRWNQQRSGFETTPIVVDGTMYLSTATNRIIALDPETGRQRWAYDPAIDKTWNYGDGLISRGVATWLDTGWGSVSTQDLRGDAGRAACGRGCLQRSTVSGFWQRGQVSLTDTLRCRPGYHMTLPPVVVDDQVIVGSA